MRLATQKHMGNDKLFDFSNKHNFTRPWDISWSKNSVTNSSRVPYFRESNIYCNFGNLHDIAMHTNYTWNFFQWFEWFAFGTLSVTLSCLSAFVVRLQSLKDDDIISTLTHRRISVNHFWNRINRERFWRSKFSFVYIFVVWASSSTEEFVKYEKSDMNLVIVVFAVVAVCFQR